MDQIIIAKTRYNDKYWLIWKTGFNEGFKKFDYPFRNDEELKNDIQVILQDENGKVLDDAICHYGSYGNKEGLWEILSESLPGDDNVEGYLTWKQVEKYFDKTIRKHSAKQK